MYVLCFSVCSRMFYMNVECRVMVVTCLVGDGGSDGVDSVEEGGEVRRFSYNQLL